MYYTGLEIQPSGRLAWTNEKQVVWGAISRAVRTPSRVDRQVSTLITSPSILKGNPQFESEDLLAYELGYRVKPHQKVFLTLSTFYNMYDTSAAYAQARRK